MGIILILLLPLLAFAEIDYTEIGWLYNVNSTKDQDANGVPDARQAWIYYFSLHEADGWDSALVCTVRTKNITTANQTVVFPLEKGDNESIYWDLMHPYFDLSETEGNSSAADTTATVRYLLRDIDTWMTANNLYGVLKVLIIGPGIALQMSGDLRCGLTGAFYGRYGSLDDKLMVLLQPGVAAYDYFEVNGLVGKNVSGGVINNYWLRNGTNFVPGVGSLYSSAGYCGGGSTNLPPPQIITCRIDGPTWLLTKALMDRAQFDTVYTYNEGALAFETASWAVVDQDSTVFAPANTDKHRYSYSGVNYYSNMHRAGLQAAFGDQILLDPSDNYEDRLGLPGGTTTTDSVLYFHNLNAYNNPRYDPKFLDSLTFPVARGAAFLSWASYGAVSLLNLDAGTSEAYSASDRQPQIIRAVANGFTYGMGTCVEPTGLASVYYWVFVRDMSLTDVCFAEASLSATQAFGATVRLGDPAGKWKSTGIIPQEVPLPPPDPPVWPTSNFDQGVPRGEWRVGDRGRWR